MFKASKLMTMPKEEWKLDLWMTQEQRAELGTLVYLSLQTVNGGTRMQSRCWKKTNQPAAVYPMKHCLSEGWGAPLRSLSGQVSSKNTMPRLRCWSLHKHWLLAEGKPHSEKA